MERLDNYLKNNGFYESREKAQKAIKEGLVFVNGKQILKISYILNSNDNVEVIKQNNYVSRGAYKLQKALDFFNVNVSELNAIDIGSSTGGFTDVLLQRNIKQVICIDVGKDQLHPKIKNDPKVKVFEQTDFRTIDDNIIKDANLVVIDVSFISTKLLMEKLNKVFNDVTIICLVKPQFECGIEIAKKFKGVIKDKKIHYNVLNELIKQWQSYNFYVNNITYSPIAGGDGNIEYLFLITRNNKIVNDNLTQIIDQAFENLSKTN